MSEAPSERRWSKLSLVPLALSGCAWAFTALAAVSLPFAFSGRSVGWSIQHWILSGSLLLGLAASVGALATGGLSFVRTWHQQRQIRGRGLAAAGCLTAMPVPIVMLGPPVLVVALVFLWLWSLDGPPDFIW